MFLDDEFDGVPLVRIMGLKRLRRMTRRQRRASNAASAGGVVGKELRSSASSSSESENTTKCSSDDETLKIIIAGAPASGKGTQCEAIRSKYGVVHLSTGDMLRAAVSEGTDVGRAAKDYMDAGKLVPDEVIIVVVKDRLSQPDCVSSGWLLDGFPLTPAQATALKSAGVSAYCFLFLNVPDSLLIYRVVGRRTDPITGKIYHMTFSPPDDDEILGRLEHRSDDTEDKVVVRLEQFHSNVDAVRGSYEDIGAEIDGSLSPGEVGDLIDCVIEEKVAAKTAA